MRIFTKEKTGTPFWRPGHFYAVLVTCVGLFTGFALRAQTVELEQYSLNKQQWQNGNEHVSYNEGDVVPYRLILQGLSKGANTVTINYDITGSNMANHAIDYLLDFNTTVKFDGSNSPESDLLINTPFATNGLSDLFGTSFTHPGFPNGLMFMIGGTVTSVIFNEGDPSMKNKTTSATINFTITDDNGNAVIFWGGHLATESAPGAGDGSGGIHGSPYHMRTLTLNGSSTGHHDRSVKVGLAEECSDLPVPGSCTPAPLCETTAGGGTAIFDLTNCNSSIIGSNTNTTIQWFDNNGAINDPANYEASDGTQVYAILSNDCGDSDPVLVTLHVNSLPGVTGVSAPAICSGSDAVFTITGTPGAVVTYTINGGGNQTVTLDATTGIGTVTVNGATTDQTLTLVSVQNPTTTCSQTLSGSTTVVVHPVPSCIITNNTNSANPDPHTSIVGQPVNYSVPSGSNFTYAWSFTSNTAGATFAGGTTTASTASVTVTSTKTGSYTLSVTVTDNNYSTQCNATCTYTMTVNPIGPTATYTQGFYGNSGGKACNGQNSYTISYNAVNAAPGHAIRYGNSTDTRSFTLSLSEISNSKTSNIFKMLPGGTTPAVLKGSSAFKNPCLYTTASYSQSCTWPSVPMSPSINNVLLAQTMALSFNLNYSSNLGGQVLTGNVLTFVKSTTTCGSNYPTTGGTTYTIPCTVFNYLKTMNGGATIGNLYKLANQVLGGEVTTITASDMNNAVNIINVGFDGGGEIIAVSNSNCVSQPATQKSTDYLVNRAQVSDLAVSAFPNPYSSKVNFIITSPVAGKANLQVYNVLGQNVKTIYTGYMMAGQKQTVSFDVPPAMRTMLFYKLQVGDQQVTGKIIQAKTE